MIDVEVKCRDHGQPGCLGTPDEQYTIQRDDSGEDVIYWCSHCGPGAFAFLALVEKAIKIRGPEFVSNILSKYEAMEAKEKS